MFDIFRRKSKELPQLFFHTDIKILYISQEITPYLKASHLGSTCQMIPHKVQENGFEVRTFMTVTLSPA